MEDGERTAVPSRASSFRSPTLPAIRDDEAWETRSGSRRSLPDTLPSSASDLNLERPLPTAQLPTTTTSLVSTLGTSTPTTVGPRPRASFSRLASLDQLMSFREELAEWKRASSTMTAFPGWADDQETKASDPREALETLGHCHGDQAGENEKEKKSDDATRAKRCSDENVGEKEKASRSMQCHSRRGEEEDSAASSIQTDDEGEQYPESRFRHLAAEVGFCLTIALTQFLGEYLITGFATELPTLVARYDTSSSAGNMSLFWPATLLTLILGATLLVFARLSDMHGGYPWFMGGTAWLAVWSTIAAWAPPSSPVVLLDVCRAMQGLAIASYMPSTFALVGRIYPEGPRRNLVMGMYAGCAPLGFFGGFLVAGALPPERSHWFFGIAAILAVATFVGGYLTVPSDRMNRVSLRLKMDWIGAGLITVGLVLVAYALSVEPYVNNERAGSSGFAFVAVWGPLAAGTLCLAVAVYYEGWRAECPLLPFEFFRPAGVGPLSIACLCFYGSYGVWLYNSAELFQSATGTTSDGEGLSGMTLALWYTPTAVAGLLLCIIGGRLLHVVPVMVLLLVSAVAWIGAPLSLALAPYPLGYWTVVLPSMLCATVGIDLTYTVSIVFFSSVQPLRYQGLSGAVASSLVNIAMSLALPISEIAMDTAKRSVDPTGNGNQELQQRATHWGFRAAFIYGAASATVGLVICVAFVRISRRTMQCRESTDEERPRETLSESTLVEDAGIGAAEKTK